MYSASNCSNVRPTQRHRCCEQACIHVWVKHCAASSDRATQVRETSVVVVVVVVADAVAVASERNVYVFIMTFKNGTMRGSWLLPSDKSEMLIRFIARTCRQSAAQVDAECAKRQCALAYY